MVSFYSRFLNLSREGLKFYEKKGLITPERDIQNGYRIYNWEEINIILMCKKLRKFGFSLNSIIDIIHQKSPDKIIEQFQKQRNALVKEVEEKSQAIISLDHKIEQLETEHRKEKYNIVQRPAIHWFSVKKNDNILDNPWNIAQSRRWLTFLPLVDGIMVWSLEKILGRQGDVFQGHMVEVKEAGPLSNEGIKLLPAAQSISTVIETRDDGKTEDIFSGILAYMREKGLTPSGDGTARIVRGFLDDKSQYHVVLQLWLPFQ